MRLAGLLLALVAVLLPASVCARPYTVDDLLRHEALGRVLVDSTGRWLVFEKREAALTLEQHGRISRQDVLRSRPYLVDLAHPAAARPLVPDDKKPGTILLGFSPAGTRLAIARLNGEHFELGTITLATGAIRWWPIAPSYDPFHRVLDWLSEDRLIMIGQPDTRAAGWLVQDVQPIELAQQRARATLQGELAVTVAGSGRFFALQPSSERRLVELDLRVSRMTDVAHGPFVLLDLAPHSQWLALAHQDRPFQGRGTDPVRENTPFILERLTLVAASSGTRWTPCPDCVLAGPPVWDQAGQRLAAMITMAGVPQILIADVHQRTMRLASAPSQRSRDAGTVGCPLRWQNGMLVVPGQVRKVAGDKVLSLSDRLIRVSGACAHGPWPSDGAHWRTASWTLHADHLIVDADGPAALRVRWTGSTTPSAIDSIAVGEAQRGALLRVRQASGAENLILAQFHGNTPLMTLNGYLRGIEPAQFVPIRHGTSGKPLISWLALPGGARQGTKLPLVIIPYAGQTYSEQPPADQSIGGERFYTSAQLLAAHGFAVLLPSLPMPDILAEAGFPFGEEIDSALSAALATGCCDSLRVALWGHSYGAYTAAMAAAQSKAYRAVVASAGIYDLAATVGTFGPRTRATPERVLPVAANYAWAEEGQGRMGAPPWAAEKRYVANSPVFLADHISAPMLITAADQDVSPLNQAEQLFSALFRQGKDAQLVTYWGEGHVISSPANLRDFYERVIGFLRAELGSAVQASDGSADWRGRDGWAPGGVSMNLREPSRGAVVSSTAFADPRARGREPQATSASRSAL